MMQTNSQGAKPKRPGRGLGRLLDCLVASLALLVTSPILLISAVVIKLTSRGPVFYRQERSGLRGQVFEMVKLRTMSMGADPVGVGTPVFAKDPRVTRIGGLLRRLSLDELPNFINVLRGEMVVVGPRPTLQAQVETYTPHQMRRLDVPPGITGWAQVNGRAGIPWEERIELDVWYVENRSPLLDVKIIGRTLKMLVTGHGLYG